MAKGLDMNSKRRLQLIKEDQAGVYTATGERLMMISIKGELKPDSQFAKFRPNGYNVDAWNALVRDHSVYSGTISLDYEQLPFLMEMLAGAPVETSTEGGVEELIYDMPEGGERDIVTVTLEDGTLLSCTRATYAFIVAISLSSERMGDEVTGNITILCKKPEAEDVPMTGVAGFEHHRLVATNATEDATIYGTVTATPGISGPALQTAIRAKGGVYANAVVVATGVAGDDGTYNITYPIGVAIPDIEAAPGDGWVGSVIAQAGPATAVIPTSIPVLPQDVTCRRAEEREDLEISDTLKGVRMSGFEFQNLAEAIWFQEDENQLDFSAHVDKDDQSQIFNIELSTRLVTGVNPDCVAMLEEANSQPSTPTWKEMGCRHKDGQHAFIVQMYTSANAVADITSNNNVRARRFPTGAVIAGGLAPVRFIVRRPVA